MWVKLLCSKRIEVRDVNFVALGGRDRDQNLEPEKEKRSRRSLKFWYFTGDVYQINGIGVVDLTGLNSNLR